MSAVSAAVLAIAALTRVHWRHILVADAIPGV